MSKYFPPVTFTSPAGNTVVARNSSQVLYYRSRGFTEQGAGSSDLGTVHIDVQPLIEQVVEEIKAATEAVEASPTTDENTPTELPAEPTAAEQPVEPPAGEPKPERKQRTPKAAPATD